MRALYRILLPTCAVTLLYLSFRGLTGVTPVFVVLFLFGIARAFFGPASASLVANLVPPEDFANAVAWNSSAWQMATIVAETLLVAWGAAVEELGEQDVDEEL